MKPGAGAATYLAAAEAAKDDRLVSKASNIMNAINPLAVSGATAERKAHEPSMEEILASIRRIIADDQSLPLRHVAETEPAAPIELTARSSRAADPAPESEPSLQAQPSRSEAIPIPLSHPSRDLAPSVTPLPRSEPVPHGPIAAPQFASPDGPEVSAPRSLHPLRPVASALDEAAESEDSPEVRADSEPGDANEPVAAGEPLFSPATDSAVAAAFNMLLASRLAENSSEVMGLVREMIRPLLRTWLDENLPSMVERLVRSEIERVARGGR